MSETAPLLSDVRVDPPQTVYRPPRTQGWLRLAMLATAGFLGPLLVFLVGDRLSHCPTTADLTSSDSGYNLTSLPKSSAVFSEPAWQTAAFRYLRQSWRLDRLRFVQIADRHLDALHFDPVPYKHVLVVAVIRGHPPKRRIADQPYMSASNGDIVSQALPLPAINSAAHLLEKTLGRLLFPLTLETARLRGKTRPLSPPFAIYDVSSGRITLETAVVEQISRFTDLPAGVTSFAEALFSQISRFKYLKEPRERAHVAQVVSSAAVSAVGIAFAYQVPIWFCVACPVVLGLLAPFVINGGLALLASAACSHWQLPAQECNDLWYGVLAAGMVLSLASAIPIVFICKLPQCAHRHQ